MTTTVLDASVAVSLIVDEPGSDAARRLIAEATLLHAPELLLLEIANAIVSRRRKKNLDDPPELLPTALQEFRSGHIILTRDAELVDAAAALALRATQPIYDCLYLALAHRHAAQVATFDRRLMTVAAGFGIPVWRPEP